MTRRGSIGKRRVNQAGRRAPQTSPVARSLSRQRLIFGACSVLAFLVVLLGTLWAVRHGATLAGDEAKSASARHVDNATCVQCHQPQARTWLRSHHAKAMAKPTPATVAGDFSGVEFERKGVVSRFFMKDGRYFVRTQGADGRPADFPVAYTFGVDPLQQYLIELPGGRLQAFTIAWDVVRKRWFDLHPDENVPPGDWLHWSGRGLNANGQCIGCHTTGFEKRFDPVTDTFASRWSEINVSCQSCHGPGAAHIAWARTRSSVDGPGPRYGLTVDFARLGPHEKVDVCAMCHSRRAELTGTFDASHPFMDQFRPTDLTPGLYYADGQQQAEVFAYGSFRQSRMYALGVTCMDCHDAHSGRLRAEGNAVCTQCHSPPGDRRFPSAARLFDDPSHHHHRPGSPGAACVNCHMPATNYMVVHSRPDHSLRLPRPDLSETLGTPNACTGCHADKPPRWAAEFVESWFAPDRGRAPSFAEALAAGRAGKVDAIPALDRLVDDTTLPAIVRATALDQLRAYGGAAADSATKALADPDPAVRRAAVAAMEGARAGTRLAQLSPVLSDPARAVRIEAARILASVPANDFDPKTRSSFEAALAEYLAAQRSSLDMPGSWLNLAVVAEAQGHPAEAERHYLAALKLDPSFTPARLNLARLNAASGKVKDAETVLRQGLARAPDQGELHYSLGLLLAEQGRLAEAATALAEAARLLPDRARVQYNYALALQQSGRRPQAETALLKAQSLAPTDRSIVYALAVFYSQDRRWQLAVSWAEKLVALDPADPQAQRFLAQLRASAEGDRRR